MPHTLFQIIASNIKGLSLVMVAVGIIGSMMVMAQSQYAKYKAKASQAAV
ncbi:MAG: hypothetical protein OXC40_02430 [Proteobacteria bacterium]|nr:hypothetical protein [Pseudomonadota bacterium]